MSQRALLLAFITALLAVTYSCWPLSTRNTMAMPKWQFVAQRNYFSHDNDPESWDFRATTQPGLGLYDREFPSDGEFSLNGTSMVDTKWNRFLRHVEHLNREDQGNKQYKIFYLIRHGQGVHNVKEAEVGRLEWDVGLSIEVLSRTSVLMQCSDTGPNSPGTGQQHGWMPNSHHRANNKPVI
jgi:hypothetical protein